MGTHPIFESDFDCLTDKLQIVAMDIIYNGLVLLLFFIEMVIASTMEKANQLLASGRMPEAADAYSDVISKDPNNYQALYRRATVYLALGKAKHAIPDLTAVLDIRKDFTQARKQRGDIYIKQGEYTKASEDFKDNPEKRQLIQSLLEEDKAYHAAMYQQNSHKIATEHLTKLVENSPWSVKYLEARADCYEHRGLYDDAILDLRPTTKLVPDNTKAWEKISWLHYVQGEVERSLETIRECLILDQDHKSCKAHYKKVKKLNKYLVNANELAQTNKWEGEEGAFEYLDSAEGANKDNIHAVKVDIWRLRCRGAAHLDQGENINYCDKAIELNSNDARTHVRRSELQTVLGKHEECIQDLEKAKEIDPNFQNIDELLQHANKRLKQSKKRDYYKILGVKRNANKKQIKKAYKLLAAKWHPDKHQGEEEKLHAEKMFRDIADAKEVLTDDEKRQQFDQGSDPLDAEEQSERNQRHHNPFQGFNPFGGGGGGGQRRG